MFSCFVPILIYSGANIPIIFYITKNYPPLFFVFFLGTNVAIFLH